MSMINIAWSGVQTAQLGMNVTSMNVANYLTPGYSRQGIIQSAIGPMGEVGMTVGNGVQVDSIRRISDQYLTTLVSQSNSKAKYFAMGNQYVSALEKVIGNDTTSLGNGLDEFVGALSALTQKPDDRALRQQLLNQAGSFAQRFNSIIDFIGSQKTSVGSQRNAIVEQVNTMSAGIADYNKKISKMEATGGNTNVLRDQRDELVKQMSSMVDVKVSEDSAGNFTVAMTNGQPLVSGKTAGQLTAAQDSKGNTTLTLKFFNSEYSINPSTGGQLGALYDYETTTLKQMKDAVQGMAESVATIFNDQLGQGFDLNGKLGKPLFVFDPTNPAGMLTVTDLKPEEIALSSDSKEVGNGNNLKVLIDLKNQPMNIPGLGNMSINDGVAAIVSTIGIASRKSLIETDAATAVYEQAQNQRDNMSAVNQDEEAINLQVYIQAFQSNMKVIAAGNQIFSDLLSMM
ncbi:flagellar hook-associated protein FlgK [Citrobacter portucalensis]|uniref:flagellar hook-associated protein FlgK n=1 Tax=Citrobacter portucalensis TaxID=1639133 RepID=UPI003CFB2DA1